MDIGFGEILVVLVIVMLLFGPSKLPGLGKALGEAIRGFKDGMHTDDSKPAPRAEEQKALGAAQQRAPLDGAASAATVTASASATEAGRTAR